MTNLIRLVFWLAVAATLYATLRTITTHMPGSDKTQHAITFGMLMLLASLAYPRASLVGLAASLTGLGAAIELIQPWFGRSDDILDWIADSIGIVVVMALIFMVRRIGGVQPRGA